VAWLGFSFYGVDTQFFTGSRYWLELSLQHGSSPLGAAKTLRHVKMRGREGGVV